MSIFHHSLKSFAGAAAAAVLACTAFSSTAAAADVIRIGATPVPHADILNFIKPKLEKEGVELKVTEFTDFVQLNLALSNKDLDANYFQSTPYLETYEKQYGVKFATLVGVHLEPMAVYSKKYKSLSEIPEGSRIALPSYPTTEGRALKVLESTGLIKLREGASLLSTVRDIAENPKNLTFYELEAAQVPLALNDVAAAVINANFALQAGLSPIKDSIAIEPSSSPFVNIVVVRPGDETKPAFQKLKAAITSPEVKKFIEEKYKGGVIPTF
ncbi:ABC transporter substrate-binding protein [Sutterella faecalis]|uniref:Lipoprotein n=2 Tax=Sutterella TaxID=40544 RepID=A0AAI9S974_9BURK|nr:MULTISPECIES: MetQ/NlpA family ABC transporter substrate-binding protein [Sutterella]KAB7649409.1 ABC transporter substrate-binding protein [Sutterella seckii]QDA53891.1 ABC transporter substrate-binding protein [Sutterella faecalis]